MKTLIRSSKTSLMNESKKIHFDYYYLKNTIIDWLGTEHKLPSSCPRFVQDFIEMSPFYFYYSDFEDEYFEQYPAAISQVTSSWLHILKSLCATRINSLRSWIQTQDSAASQAFPVIEFYHPDQDEFDVQVTMRRWKSAGGRFYDERMLSGNNDQVIRRFSKFGSLVAPFEWEDCVRTRPINSDDCRKICPKLLRQGFLWENGLSPGSMRRLCLLTGASKPSKRSYGRPPSSVPTISVFYNSRCLKSGNGPPTSHLLISSELSQF